MFVPNRSENTYVHAVKWKQNFVARHVLSMRPNCISMTVVSRKVLLLLLPLGCIDRPESVLPVPVESQMGLPATKVAYLLYLGCAQPCLPGRVPHRLHGGRSDVGRCLCAAAPCLAGGQMSVPDGCKYPRGPVTGGSAYFGHPYRICSVRGLACRCSLTYAGPRLQPRGSACSCLPKKATV